MPNHDAAGRFQSAMNDSDLAGRGESMGLRKWLKHTLSLALTGWYLMSAPYVGSVTNRHIDRNAPLLQWLVLVPYHSHDECQIRLSSYAKQIIFVQLSEQVSK